MKTLLQAEKTSIESLWQKVEKKVSVTSDRIKDTMPYTTKGGQYDDCEATDAAWWTNTFWTGILWHLYNETKQDK